MTTTNIIDCDATPFCPEGWEIVEHKKCGQVEWNPEKITFYLSDIQKRHECDACINIYNELKGRPVLNANIIDYLLANPNLIPEKWADYGYLVIFWGTIYRDPEGNLCVRCIGLNNRYTKAWDEFFRISSCGLNGNRTPSALLKQD